MWMGSLPVGYDTDRSPDSGPGGNPSRPSWFVTCLIATWPWARSMNWRRELDAAGEI
jgi:hypothetical protein